MIRNSGTGPLSTRQRPWKSCLALSVGFLALGRTWPTHSTLRAFDVALSIFWLIPTAWHFAAEIWEEVRGR